MGEFINVLVSKGKSNLIPEKDNLYGQFVGEWDFEWVDNQGTTGERHVQGEWIFAWVLEGTAIQDVFICPSRKARIKDYQPDAAYATAVRMYNPNTEAWDILYTELGEGLHNWKEKEKETGLFRRKLMRRIYSGCFQKLQRLHSVGNVW